MNKNLALTFIFALSMAIQGCSTSKKSETDAAADEVPVADVANTDAVPAGEVAPDAAPLADPVAVAEPVAPVADPVAPVVAAADTGSGETVEYTVQEGDTLMKIAFETYGDVYQWKKILEANKEKLSGPGALAKGTVIKVEKPSAAVQIDRNGEKYLIKGGDTLGTISNDVYQTPKKWRKLYENNKQLIHDPNRIFAGFFLYYVPEAGAAPMAEAPKPVETRAPAAAAPAVPAETAPPAVPSAPESPTVTDGG